MEAIKFTSDASRSWQVFHEHPTKWKKHGSSVTLVKKLKRAHDMGFRHEKLSWGLFEEGKGTVDESWCGGGPAGVTHWQVNVIEREAWGELVGGLTHVGKEDPEGYT